MGVNGHWYCEIEKQGYWRGQTHTWVNRYIMSGAQPSAADALTVLTALAQIEDQIYPPVVGGLGLGILGGRAYPSGKGSFFASSGSTEPVPPSATGGFTGPPQPYTTLKAGATLENCVVIETKLQGVSSTGKPIFLRKYMRGIATVSSEIDATNGISSADLAQIATLTAPWRTGMGASNWVVIGSSGAQAAQAPAALQFIGNRQVPKGRKKKKTSSGLLTSGIESVIKLAATAVADAA